MGQNDEWSVASNADGFWIYCHCLTQCSPWSRHGTVELFSELCTQLFPLLWRPDSTGSLSVCLSVCQSNLILSCFILMVLIRSYLCHTTIHFIQVMYQLTSIDLVRFRRSTAAVSIMKRSVLTRNSVPSLDLRLLPWSFTAWSRLWIVDGSLLVLCTYAIIDWMNIPHVSYTCTVQHMYCVFMYVRDVYQYV